MSQKKRYVFLGIIICGLFVISAKLLNVVKETYTRYRSDVDVALQTTTGEMVCTLKVDTDETYIDEHRINAVVNAVKRRLQNIEQIIRERQSEIFAYSYSSTEDDVEENVAEDYSPKMEL